MILEEANSKPFANAKIFYRIFPLYKMQWNYIKVLENRKTIYAQSLQHTCYEENYKPTYWRFDTDGVFYNDTQEEIYETVMDGAIERILEGINVVVLNFGQTGCGKTLTATGLSNCYKDRGIALRLISDIFRTKESLRRKLKMCVQVSYIETKNTVFSDLLSKNHDVNLQNLQNITTITVKSEYAAMKLLFNAEARRQFADDSLTSHVGNGVFTVTVTTKPLFFSNPIMTMAKVHIVDLGGADYYGSSVSSHKNLMELRKANLTKTNLDQFMSFLCKTNLSASSSKERLDILLHYLGDSFSSHGILRLIGHIRVEKENLSVSISMLKFGQTLRGIKPSTLQPNLSVDKDLEILYLENKLRDMQKQYDLSYMINCKDHNISQNRIHQMQTITMDYLLEQTDEIVICNVTDMMAVLDVFKGIYNKLEEEKVEIANLAYLSGLKEGSSTVSKRESTGSKNLKRSSQSSKTKQLPGASIKKPNNASVSPKVISEKTENLDTTARRGTLKSDNQEKMTTTTKSVRRSSKMSPIHRKRCQSPANLKDVLGKFKKTSRSFNPKETSSPSIKKTSHPNKNEDFRTSALNEISKSVFQDKGSLSAKSFRRSRLSTNTIKPTIDKATLENASSIVQILEEQELPFLTSLPIYSEAWTEFVNDSNYNYSELEEEKLMQESNVKNTHKAYLEEIRALQTCLKLMDIRKSELQRAQMARLFGKEKLDVDGTAIRTHQEGRCIDNFELVRSELIQQQEKVLKCQSDFVIALQTLSTAKKDILDRFEEYCRKFYQISVPNLHVASISQEVDRGVDISCMAEEQISSIVIEDDQMHLMYNKLQKILKKEILKLSLSKKIKSKKSLK